MLTRLEVDGFKTLRQFHLDVSPFLVVLGRNASGKSNMFDAILLLRRLSEMPVIDAVQDMRGTLDELFHHRQDGSQLQRVTLAAEVLLEPTVTDRYSERVDVHHSRIRYEVTIEKRMSERGVDRLFVSEEKASLIRKDDDRWLRAMKPSRSFRAAYLKYANRKSSTLLDTLRPTGGKAEFEIHQDGHQGRPRMLPAHTAEATALSSITTTEFPLLYALRSELQSWRFLQLDPAVDLLEGIFGRQITKNVQGFPVNAAAVEDCENPKVMLERVAQASVARRRRNAMNISQYFATIGESISLESLREANAFRRFEESFKAVLLKIRDEGKR